MSPSAKYESRGRHLFFLCSVTSAEPLKFPPHPTTNKYQEQRILRNQTLVIKVLKSRILPVDAIIARNPAVDGANFSVEKSQIGLKETCKMFPTDQGLPITVEIVKRNVARYHSGGNL